MGGNEPAVDSHEYLVVEWHHSYCVHKWRLNVYVEKCLARRFYVFSSDRAF